MRLSVATPAVRSSWPWLVLAIATIPAVWHASYVPTDLDPEHPRVARSTYSAYPPAAYRLAEPGDTLDRLGLYFAAGGLVLGVVGAIRSVRNDGNLARWPTAIALAAAGTWLAATPYPTFDGWHGLTWASVLDPAAPRSQRIGLAIAGVVLTVVAIVPLMQGRVVTRRGRALFVVGGLLMVARIVDPQLGDPPGYWPRWGFAIGWLAVDLALIQLLPAARSRVARVGSIAIGGAAWAGLIVAGLVVVDYHRPIERLRAIVPGRIFIGAMPTREGLEIAHGRHRFRTIINLFPEDLPGLRSPLLDDELSFAKAHGIDYLGNSSDHDRADAFLDETLKRAQDPDAWPILVHCHACMDRTPAWWGIYGFVVEGKPLRTMMQAIEQHRGDRPKASVTLLMNRVLPRLAPDRAASDPTLAELRAAAAGTPDPYESRQDGPRTATEPQLSQRVGATDPVRRP